MESSTEEEWNILWQRYIAEDDPHKKKHYLAALTKTKDTVILENLIQIGKNTSLVRSQDYLSLLSRIARNNAGNEAVWKFITSEWNFLVERFGLSSRGLGNLPKTVVSSWKTQEQLERLEAFFAKHPEAGAGLRARGQAKQRILNNMAWEEVNREEVVIWLAENVNKDMGEHVRRLGEHFRRLGEHVRNPKF